jgi:NADH-quinone oxidoreductase subunit L
LFSETLAWLIIALPVAAFLLNGTLVRAFLGSEAREAGWITISAVAGSFILALFALASVASNGAAVHEPHSWLSVQGFDLTFGILLDQLTAIMFVVVSGVSLVVQFYSQQYMYGDKSYTRYYSFMALFTASMLGLVSSRNVVQLFVFWELVGVSSYLLIGFWMERPSAAAAAKKAFLMTRFGDFGFLLGILYLFYVNPSYLDIPTLYAAVGAGAIAAGVATWVSLGLFMGAVGKSAQFPLHSWLPDAMEGPTSVSALIHSATMVTAGVFLVARFFPLFHASNVMDLVVLIGGVTAVFAASMGLVANDIKRVLAYSTISQLGYMIMALGLGAYAPAIFHLFTHAFFKAGLFLGSGSVHHASGTFNMKYMGGLRKDMPWTYWTMVIGSLSLAGIFPFSGFWSKDELLASAFERGSTIGWIALLLGLVAAVMTAFYMFRAIYLTFHGEYKGGAEAEAEDAKKNDLPMPVGLGHTHRHESPWVMVAPLVVLASLAIVIGFLVNPLFDIGPIKKHAFATFVTERNVAVFTGGHGEVADAGHGGAVDDSHGEPSHMPDAVEAGAAPEFSLPVAVVSTVLAVGGILLAYSMYITGSISPTAMGRRLPTVHNLLYRKYYVDELYEDRLVIRVFYARVVRFLSWFDVAWVDNVNVQLSKLTANVGRGLANVQTGQMQTYAAIMAIGVVVALVALLVWGN